MAELSWRREFKSLFGGADGVLYALMVLIVVLSPLVRGGNRLWFLSILECLIFGVLAIWLLFFSVGIVELPRAFRRASMALLLWLIWLSYLLLQIVPIPFDALSNFLPAQAGVYAPAAEYLGGSIDYGFVSVSIGDSVAHIMESLAYCCVFILILLLVHNRSRLKFFLLSLLLSGVFQSLYGVVFLFSGSEYGWFFDQASPLQVATGTFVNRNHFAAYLELCGAAGIGLVLSRFGAANARSWKYYLREISGFLLSETMCYRVFVALIVVGLLFSRSRGGNLAFFSGLALVGALYVLLRERRYFWRAGFVLLTFFVIDLWVLGSWFGLDKLVDRLATTTIDSEMRITVFPFLVQVARDYWPTGAGGGSFYTVFPSYRPVELQYYYDHAHNDYMEFFIETGAGAFILGGIVLLCVWHSLSILNGRKDRLACGVSFASLMAVGCLAIHGVSDFNLQIPSVALTLVVLIALPYTLSIQGSRRGSAPAKDSAGAQINVL